MSKHQMDSYIRRQTSLDTDGASRNSTPSPHQPIKGHQLPILTSRYMSHSPSPVSDESSSPPDSPGVSPLSSPVPSPGRASHKTASASMKRGRSPSPHPVLRRISGGVQHEAVVRRSSGEAQQPPRQRKKANFTGHRASTLKSPAIITELVQLPVVPVPTRHKSAPRGYAPSAVPQGPSYRDSSGDLNNDMTEYGADQDAEDDDPAALKRRLNTDAARRSRQRKLNYVKTLEATVAALKREKDELALAKSELEVKVEVLRECVVAGAYKADPRV